MRHLTELMICFHISANNKYAARSLGVVVSDISLQHITTLIRKLSIFPRNSEDHTWNTTVFMSFLMKSICLDLMSYCI